MRLLIVFVVLLALVAIVFYVTVIWPFELGSGEIRSGRVEGVSVFVDSERGGWGTVKVDGHIYHADEEMAFYAYRNLNTTCVYVYEGWVGSPSLLYLECPTEPLRQETR